MFLNYIHRFRGIAILFIVTGHCTRFFDWGNSPQMERICKVAFLNGTVLFVFIAGFLFQHLSHKYTYKQYLITKLKHIILPYIFISIPIIIYLVFIEKLGHWAYPDLNEKSYLFQITWFYITGKHLAPLWFIPMISIFYLLYPLFIAIDNNVKAYFYIIPIFIAVSALIHRPPAEINVFHTSVYFFSVYLLGMFCSRFRSYFLTVIDKLMLLLLFLFATLFVAEILFHESVGIIYVKRMFFHDKEFLDINLFQKLILCGLLVNVLYKYEKFFNRFLSDKILTNLAGLSFGIYFLHYYFLELHFKTKRIFHYEFSGNIIMLLVSTSVVCMICIIILKTVKRFAGHRSRYVIGC